MNKKMEQAISVYYDLVDTINLIIPYVGCFTRLSDEKSRVNIPLELRRIENKRVESFLDLLKTQSLDSNIKTLFEKTILSNNTFYANFNSSPVELYDRFIFPSEFQTLNFLEKKPSNKLLLPSEFKNKEIYFIGNGNNIFLHY